MRALALLLLLATPALAETPMTAEDFDAFATGKTLDYYDPVAGHWGTEAYLAGRKVLWQEPGKGCSGGSWYADGPALCFAYDGVPTPACWIFVRHGDRVVAHYRDDPPDRQPVQVVASDRPLACGTPVPGSE